MSWQGLNFDFTGVVFDGGDFRRAQFSGGTVHFGFARFSGGTVHFHGARFSGGTVHFHAARCSGGTVDFGSARFSGGTVHFGFARFSGGTVDFGAARFSGGTVDFRAAQFSGSEVDFSAADDWSVPPSFPWTDTPPLGVRIPRRESLAPHRCPQAHSQAVSQSGRLGEVLSRPVLPGGHSWVRTSDFSLVRRVLYR